MATKPEYRMDTGTPDQLPKGAAQTLNQAVDQSGSQDTQAAPTGESQAPTDQAAPPALPPIQRVRNVDTSMGAPPGEDDSLLYGPTSRPDEHITAGTGIAARPKPPADAHKWLPALVEAAKDPSAPQMFKEMLALVQHHMGQ